MSHELPDQNLARTIAEAVFDPAKWIDVCDGFAALTGGSGSLIFPNSSDQGRLSAPHSASLQDSFSRYANEGWYKRDLRFNGVPKMLRLGYIVDADCIDYDDVAKDAFYQDFLRPEKLRWFLAMGFGLEQNLWILSIQRTLGQDTFSSDDIQKALSYRALLNNSATIARHLGFARVLGAASVLEQHGLCAMALDANGRVVHVSASAERHLGDDLQIIGGRLRSIRSADAPALARLITGICGRTSLSNFHVSLPRTGGRLPLVLYGCMLPEAQCDIFQPAVALLVISDPLRLMPVPTVLLMDCFGLTSAEAGLAEALMAGTDVYHYAAEHGIRPVTARNHLQALLRKTSTHRQAELIVVLSKVIPRV